MQLSGYLYTSLAAHARAIANCALRKSLGEEDYILIRFLEAYFSKALMWGENAGS
jgi:hypothetical protein